MKTFRLTPIERDEAERVMAATADLNLGSGIWLRFPRANAKEGVTPTPYAIWRFTAPNGRRREMGLGPVPRANLSEIAQRLSQARVEVAGYREQLRQAVDPIQTRIAEQARQRATLQQAVAVEKAERATLARVARDYHERVIEPNRTVKHSLQWIRSLENNVPGNLWHKPIHAIEPPELLAVLEKMQREKPETASRVRQRLDAVFDDAMFRKLCKSNPAEPLKRKLREALAGKKRKKGKFAALPYAQMPAFIRDLRTREGIAARALEFAALTAARTAEVLGATWGEFDMAAKLWTIPGSRMKGGEVHAVYLSDRAIELVESMRELGQPYVFPSPLLNGGPLSNMGMLAVLRRMGVHEQTTVHGLCRASFSTWANETAAARPDVIEACLAHRESNLVKAAYNRAEFTRERRELLRRWAAFLDGQAVPDNVVSFPAQRVA